MHDLLVVHPYSPKLQNFSNCVSDIYKLTVDSGVAPRTDRTRTDAELESYMGYVLKRQHVYIIHTYKYHEKAYVAGIEAAASKAEARAQRGDGCHGTGDCCGLCQS